METITTIVGLINRASIPARLWVDGSFLTEKQNPQDCDITLVLVESVYHSLSADQHEFFEWFRRVSLFAEYKCNNYAIVVDAERDDWELVYTYWLRQYGFDREKHKKGVVEILVPFLESA